MQAGGCQCGNVRYECADAPVRILVCHCAECRKQSASAFGITYVVPATSFRLTAGTPGTWSRQADSGNRIDCAFCPVCGSRVWHRSSATPDFVNVKAGSLDAPIDLSEATHLWTSRKLPGVVIPEHARQFARQPA
jgi:hypothetical protein